MKRFPVRLEKRRQQKLTHCPNGVLSLSQVGEFLDKKPLPLKEFFFQLSAIHPSGGTMKSHVAHLSTENRCQRFRPS